MALSPGGLGGSGSRPEEASGTSQPPKSVLGLTNAKAKGRDTKTTVGGGSLHAGPLLRVRAALFLGSHTLNHIYTVLAPCTTVKMEAQNMLVLVHFPKVTA